MSDREAQRLVYRTLSILMFITPFVVLFRALGQYRTQVGFAATASEYSLVAVALLPELVLLGVMLVSLFIFEVSLMIDWVTDGAIDG